MMTVLITASAIGAIVGVTLGAFASRYLRQRVIYALAGCAGSVTLALLPTLLGGNGLISSWKLLAVAGAMGSGLAILFSSPRRKRR